MHYATEVVDDDLTILSRPDIEKRQSSHTKEGKTNKPSPMSDLSPSMDDDNPF